MLAQSLAEYGLMAAMASAVQKTSNAVTLFARDAGPGTWAILGIAVAGGLWILLRRGGSRT